MVIHKCLVAFGYKKLRSQTTVMVYKILLSLIQCSFPVTQYDFHLQESIKNGVKSLDSFPLVL